MPAPHPRPLLLPPTRPPHRLTSSSALITSAAPATTFRLVCPAAHASIYTNASLFPDPPRVWKHRYHRTHGLQFFCQWTSPASLFPAQARQLAHLLSGGLLAPAAFVAGGPALLHVRSHWVPATPHVLALPAVTRYTARRAFPPPPLGHPLPPVPILGTDNSPLAAIFPRTFHPATQIRPPGSPCVLPRARSVFAYGPTGHLSGALPPASLTSLWARFCCRAHGPHKLPPTGPAFAEALHLLLERYRDSPRAPPASAPGGALLRGHWTISPRILRALSNLCSTQYHLLASPASGRCRLSPRLLPH